MVQRSEKTQVRLTTEDLSWWAEPYLNWQGNVMINLFKMGGGETPVLCVSPARAKSLAELLLAACAEQERQQ